MKIIQLTTSCLVFLLISCSSNKMDSPPKDKEIDEMTSILSKGFFVSGAHTTTGKAYVDVKKKTLKFKDFKTDSGPNLLVYLTVKIGSSDFVSLGSLKGIKGDYTYDIPKNTDLDKYNIVDIWCVDFSVSFGHTTLKK